MKSRYTTEKLGVELGAAILGACDCPEYEELSALVDGSLDQGQSKRIRSHANMCEICSRDIVRIEELRSHATLRDKITVRPGASRDTISRRVGVWKRALAAISVAAIVAAIAIGLGDFTTAPKNTSVVAVKPPVVKETAPKPPPSVETAKPAPSAVATVKETPAAPKPTYAMLLADGSYRVIKREGKLVFAKADGTPARSSLEDRIAASIAEKLRTGRVKPTKPIQVAMADIKVRDGEGYVPPPTAPVLAGPIGKILMSDQPTLSWSKVDLAESYRVRIFDESGRVVVDETTGKTSFMPSSSLQRGRLYRWRVGVRFSESDDWAESAAAWFKLLSNDDLALIKRAKVRFPGSRLALGTAYESLGLYEEAASEYRALRRANPGSRLAERL